jgi:hypothetical protein
MQIRSLEILDANKTFLGDTILPSGYKIIESPSNVIYLPINTKQLDEIIIKITDQDGNLVNFREEVITVRLHLRRIH